MKLSFPPVITLACLGMQFILYLMLPLEVNLSLLLGLILLIGSVAIIVMAFKELQNAVFEGGLADMLKGLADRLGELALRTAAFVRLVSGTQSVADVTGVGPGDPTGQNNALTKLIQEELFQGKKIL